ncbi:phospholipase D-like domain-containing protein [Bacteroides sp. AN502(2024)]|uniref:phospholipase D-like domain-containing protein n=1 Tax=Bacteroides sp. AN502(2024) TaxID=3160599 RepID=UPI003517E5D9
MKKDNKSNETKVMKQKFSTEIRTVFDKEYVKVFFLDNHDLNEYKMLLEKRKEVKSVSITKSESRAHGGDTLTVYPKPMVDGRALEDIINISLTKYLSGIHEEFVSTVSEVHFNDIENRILSALDSAKASVDLCMAWFTNEKLRDKLLEKKAEGCEVRVIRYKDGVNQSKGVDLSNINHIEIRGERHGIMHRKFCVIDNQTVLDGPYNWTNNAETKNDEDVLVHKNALELASSYTKEFNRIWKLNENENLQ